MNLDSIKDNITGILGNFPNLTNLNLPTDLNELSNIIPEFGNLPNLDDFKLPDMENMPDIQKVLSDTEQLFKDKCAKESGSDAAYEEAKVFIVLLIFTGRCHKKLFLGRSHDVWNLCHRPI